MLIEIMEKMYQEPKRVEGTREVGVMPNVNERENSTFIRIIPEKFKSDLEALEGHIGQQLQTGLCINVTLSKLLSIVPRDRKRVDSYNALKSYLIDELGVQLNIKSKKSK